MSKKILLSGFLLTSFLAVSSSGNAMDGDDQETANNSSFLAVSSSGNGMDDQETVKNPTLPKKNNNIGIVTRISYSSDPNHYLQLSGKQIKQVLENNTVETRCHSRFTVTQHSKSANLEKIEDEATYDGVRIRRGYGTPEEYNFGYFVCGLVEDDGITPYRVIKEPYTVYHFSLTSEENY